MTEPHSDPLVDGLQQFRSVAASALALAIVLAREAARRAELDAVNAQRATREQARRADAERAGRDAMSTIELERYIRSDPIGAAQAWVAVEMNKTGDPETARRWETAMRNLGIEPKEIREQAQRIADATTERKLSEAEAGAAVGQAQRSQAQQDAAEAKFYRSDFVNETDVRVEITKAEVLRYAGRMSPDELEVEHKQTGRKHDAHSWVGQDPDVDKVLLNKFPDLAQEKAVTDRYGSAEAAMQWARTEAARPLLAGSPRQADDPRITTDPTKLREAAALVTEGQFGSTAMLQRRMRLGYAEAFKVMDDLERCGIVGPARGASGGANREVLVSREQSDDRVQRGLAYSASMEEFLGKAGHEDHAAAQAGAQAAAEDVAAGQSPTAGAAAAQDEALAMDEQSMSAADRARAASTERPEPAPGAWSTGQGPAKLAGQGHAVGPAEAMGRSAKAAGPKGGRAPHRAGPTRDRGRAGR